LEVCNDKWRAKKVENQDRAKEFRTEKVGFNLVSGRAYEGGRWIELSPSEGRIVLVLSPRALAERRREVNPRLPHSPIFFNCTDIQQTDANLAGQGVRSSQPPIKMGFGWSALFEDCEGSRYALGQW
jgi:predicted enzyme related to lactoylglutathione lyase